MIPLALVATFVPSIILSLSNFKSSTKICLISSLKFLLKALEKPYENNSNLKDFQITGKLNKSGYKTYCGT